MNRKGKVQGLAKKIGNSLLNFSLRFDTISSVIAFGLNFDRIALFVFIFDLNFSKLDNHFGKWINFNFEKNNNY